ncbi:N5-carboxyaminoimidazole ribonucleotide synthase [Phycisphaerae bacterium RAS1]|nr:N5-carboxyaminoimidazole ribonucleotide synthase [Phycisphaerae bacterium RAS1]
MKVGVLGGGQLGRMLALAGYPLGIHTRFLERRSDCPAGYLEEVTVGAYDDPQALETFAQDIDVATFEFENVPESAARFLSGRVPVYPPPASLGVTQDRLAEKRLFEELGIATAPFRAVDSLDQLHAALDALGPPVVLKRRRLGYDGKGQTVIRSADEIAPAWAHLGDAAGVLESFIEFERELSLISVRGRDGEIRHYPPCHNVHRDGILNVTIAPALDLDATMVAAAEQANRRILEHFQYVGVLTVEYFVSGSALLANETAPRVHNSGHWTIEGADASQFENHLRAILGLPLGSTRAVGFCGMINLIGTVPPLADLLRLPGVHVHLYGKEPRPGRKLGHLTVFDATREGMMRQFRALRGVAMSMEI